MSLKELALYKMKPWQYKMFVDVADVRPNDELCSEDNSMQK